MERGHFDNHRGKALYYALHGSPGGASSQVWVMCNALLEEATFAARPWVELAAALAGCGQAVLRFDYEGQGDSAGDIGAIRLQDWIDDIAAAVAFAKQRCPGEVDVNLLALRGGALLAAAAADRVGARRLVLIEPVLDGGKYFDECLRAHMTTQLACFNKVNEPRAVLREQLQRGQRVSVLGHDLGRGLSGPLGELQLAGLLGQAAAEVDIIHVPRNRARGMPPALEELSALPRLRLHASTAPTFWDNLGCYWELSDELRAMSIAVVGGPDAPHRAEAAR